MKNSFSRAIHLRDYRAPAWWVDTVDLDVSIADNGDTTVGAVMLVRRNENAPRADLELDGEALELIDVRVDDVTLDDPVSLLKDSRLVLTGLPDSCRLTTRVRIRPDVNTTLSGLFRSKDGYFTQCEAEGFRRITYFPDRPDVMSRYTVTLHASRERFPDLLANGNLEASGDEAEGRHWARWVDPFPKPCYLFALVAGNLVAREQRIVSRSGTEHLLQVFVRPGDMDKTEHAMNSLMASVAWDEARFGLPLDLERFMIVATADFNMGAMENKGLNIFNTKYVLANSATATDTDFANIESVVGHEYFHNWTGNRVTCRDWFQLSLKEGLTVFRDQEFSMDLCADPSARAVKRIEDVRVLRTAQFPEDAGPMAHPVRPDQYVEINNFYTVTVYEKGAEVVRMMQTMTAGHSDPSGRDGFARGMKLYFERHDGQAVTCDDFAQAVADANPDSTLARLLPQFKRWYSQAGTPRVKVRSEWNAADGSYTLHFSQSCPPTPGSALKQPFVVPVAIGLLDAEGRDLPLSAEQRLFVLTEEQQSLRIEGLNAEPVPSLLRGFSAPVVLEHDYTDAQLLTLLAHDSDPFNRWEAGQRLVLRRALAAIATPGPVNPLPLDLAVIDALRAVLRHDGLDAAFKELVLTFPSETYISEQLDTVDPQRVHTVREAMRQQLATALHDDWVWALETHSDNGGYRPDPRSAGRRALCGLSLTMLCLSARASGDAVWPGRTYQRFKDAGNMTDRFNALSALVISDSPLARDALTRFHAMFRHEALVLDKWFALQAGAPDRGGNILPAVRQLLGHPDFSLRNPNRARSVIFSYCSANPGAFHRADAAGYVFWSDRVIEIDRFNPQVAARLARALDRWKKLAEPYRSAAREAIARVAAQTELSNDVREVVTRALAD